MVHNENLIIIFFNVISFLQHNYQSQKFGFRRVYLLIMKFWHPANNLNCTKANQKNKVVASEYAKKVKYHDN